MKGIVAKANRIYLDGCKARKEKPKDWSELPQEARTTYMTAAITQRMKTIRRAPLVGREDDDQRREVERQWHDDEAEDSRD